MSKQNQKQKARSKKLLARKGFKQIITSDKIVHQNIKIYKGSRTDTNLLNIKFKTIICSILNQMRQAKELAQDEASAIKQYKESPASFNSLIDLIYQKELDRNDKIYYLNSKKVFDGQNIPLIAHQSLLTDKKDRLKWQQEKVQKTNLSGVNGMQTSLNQQRWGGFKVKCPEILERLKQLFQSSEIVRRIYQTQGFMDNKVLMFKYVEAIRYTLIGKGSVVRWKQLKQVSVLS